MSKKVWNDANINFRLPKETKAKFIQLCEQMGEHYQTQLKKMINDFINKPIKDLEKQKREEYLKNERLL